MSRALSQIDIYQLLATSVLVAIGILLLLGLLSFVWWLILAVSHVLDVDRTSNDAIIQKERRKYNRSVQHSQNVQNNQQEHHSRDDFR